MPRLGSIADTSVYDYGAAFDTPGEQTYDRRLDETWPGRLVQDAWSAVQAPGRALQSTEPITSEQMIKPAADLAGLVTGGSYAKPAMKDASGMGIRAYHSSPHDFDKFDLSKIGTGEGAQVYGHGLYFAENPAVSGQGGQYWNQFLNKFEGPERDLANRLSDVKFDRKDLAGRISDDIKRTQFYLDNPDRFPNAALYKQHMHDLISQRDAIVSGKPVGPRTYEVDINADPAHMLDWDKPLAEMSPRVKDALRDTWMAHPEGHSQQTGSQIYKINERQMATGGRGLAYKLNEAGIPGIRYLDQGSRGLATTYNVQSLSGPSIPYLNKADAQQQLKLLHKQGVMDAKIVEHTPPTSNNYVVFDPSIIDILKKYGIAGAAPAGMGALAAQDAYQPRGGL